MDTVLEHESLYKSFKILQEKSISSPYLLIELLICYYGHVILWATSWCCLTYCHNDSIGSSFRDCCHLLSQSISDLVSILIHFAHYSKMPSLSWPAVCCGTRQAPSWWKGLRVKRKYLKGWDNPKDLHQPSLQAQQNIKLPPHEALIETFHI